MASYNAYREAYCEVIYLINNMSIENQNKISKKFKEFLESQKSDTYKVCNISLSNLNSLKRETKILLSIIYRNYFCTPEKRTELEKADKKALDELYNYENIFNNSNNKIAAKKSEGDVSVLKRNKLNYLIEKIKDFFTFNKN